MKGFLKFLGVVVAILVLAYLVYAFLLPENIKEVADYHIMKLTDKETMVKIEAVQNVKPYKDAKSPLDEYKDVTYVSMYEKSTTNARWKFIEGDGETADRVVYKGDNMTFTFAGTDLGDDVYNKEPFEVQYELTPDGRYDIYIFIGKERMENERKDYVMEQLAKLAK